MIAEKIEFGSTWRKRIRRWEIGAEYADRILALRRERGSFGRPDDLLLVRGIGPRTMERLRPLITVGTPPARRDSLTP